MIVMCIGDKIRDNVIYTRKGKKCKLTIASYERVMRLEDSSKLTRTSTCFYGWVLVATFKETKCT